MIYLIHGDALEELERIQDIDLVLTDPPFAISNDINTQNEWNGYTSNKGEWDEEVDSHWVDYAYKCLREGGLFAAFGTFGSLVPIFIELEKQENSTFQSHIVWHKTNPAPSIHRRMYTHANEIILLYSKGSNWTFNYEMSKTYNEGKQLHNVWDSGVSRRKLERTRKPDSILTRLITPLTNKDDWILDPFCGTCSIVEIAATLGRNVVGIDNDKKVIEWSYKHLKANGHDVQYG